ncbi:hypothetical protein NDU88_003228 [Pleurodeles waltl]|uniref:Uncharacterized protein n=1 Tax=Pleurodeles waltl TaxID=8319 RepID=A0AAV7UYE1_PLEWA|nr:hypothetical protein NDU88_003228 [Pleurodeles waltl]
MSEERVNENNAGVDPYPPTCVVEIGSVKIEMWADSCWPYMLIDEETWSLGLKDLLEADIEPEGYWCLKVRHPWLPLRILYLGRIRSQWSGSKPCFLSEAHQITAADLTCGMKWFPFCTGGALSSTSSFLSSAKCERRSLSCSLVSLMEEGVRNCHCRLYPGVSHVARRLVAGCACGQRQWIDSGHFWQGGSGLRCEVLDAAFIEGLVLNMG